MKHRRAEAVAKQEGLLSDPVGYLKRIRYAPNPSGVAKQEVLARQVDELFKYLITRERVAKQDGADGQRTEAL